jgi:subtilisin family serine protease
VTIVLRNIPQQGKKLLLLAFTVAVLVLPGAAALAQDLEPDAPGAEAPAIQPYLDEKAVPGQIIVKYEENVGPSEQAGVRSKEGLEKEDELDLINAEVVQVEDKPIEEAIGDLEDKPEVEYAEPNFKVYPTAYRDEPYFDQLWGLHNTGQNGGNPDVDINGPEASDITQGDPNLVVAVIDNGVDFTHPDLAERAWTNPGEVANNGVDDDNNGYVDDLNGWDFHNNDATVHDLDRHGTHVAGTIAASVNGDGVVGVAPNVEVMALKFLGPRGGAISNAIKAIEYTKSEGAKISNNSWGGGGRSQALKDAIDASGMLFVAAAGNGGGDSLGDDNDQRPFYPASYDALNILSVAAINRMGNLARFSNFGATSVDISAPGVNVLSSLPRRPNLSAIALSSVGTSGRAVTSGFGVEEIGDEADRVAFMSKSFSVVDRGAQEVVLVDDDMSSPDRSDFVDVGPMVSAAIQSATGDAPTVINVPPDFDEPSLNQLRGKTVVWATGQASGVATRRTLTKTDRDTLTDFLNDGGKLVLTGRDALRFNENTPFVTDTLGLKMESDGYDLVEVRGSSGSAFAEESYLLNGPTADSDLHDVLTPAGSAATTQGLYPASDYSWGTLSGTSMATPHATGAAALAASVNPTLLGDPAALKKVVMDGGKPLTATDGKTVTGDMVDAEAALRRADANPPDAPTLDLETGSDTGRWANDDVTSIDRPVFSGKAEANSTIRLYEGAKFLGEDKADGESTAEGKKGWNIALSEALSDGKHTITANARDAVGNVSNTPDPSLTVTIDTVAPSITFTGNIFDNQRFYYGDVPPEHTCSADDGTEGSGVDGECTVRGYSDKVGNHALVGTAKDIAGNEDQQQLTYNVLPWTPKGFYPPVDMREINNVKAGRTVPIKFEMFKGDKELTDTYSVKELSATPIECGTGSTDRSEVTATGGTSLRYDTDADQFVFNWKTPRDKAGACYKLTMTTRDEVSSLSAIFELR